MGGDPERRFQSAMDKLFYVPKSTLSSSRGQSISDKKYLNTTCVLASMESKSSENTPETLLCRPWDRGDLMRRLATFKSMTWFAKPKVVSALNCARRGWINVEMDTIACETCKARMLFSTPSSWTQQQVDKTALVFSLKLDSGHKMLCPWMDNVCDEALAQFPPTTPPVLVDGYKQRSYRLYQLAALPVISFSVVDHMRSPQLEQLLSQSVATECLGDEHEASSADLYCKVQKLISLCGWELRSLPYVVDGKYQFNQSDTKGVVEVHDSEEYPSDPNSFVLECKLCGASVGLWAFSLVPRPAEHLRLVGHAVLNGEKNSVQEYGNVNLTDGREGAGQTALSNDASSRNKRPNLSLTIAGGPLPEKQNFRATISLPLVGQNLRARLLSDTVHPGAKLSDPHKYNETEASVNGHVVQLEGMELSKNQGDNVQHSSFSGNEKGGSLCNEHHDGQMTEGKDVNEPGIGNQESPTEIPGQLQIMGQNDKLTENEQNVRSFREAVVGCTSSQVDELSATTSESCANNMECNKNDFSAMAMIANCKHVLGTAAASESLTSTGHQPSSTTEAAQTGLRKGVHISDVEDSSGARLKDQNGHGIKSMTQSYDGIEAASSIANYLKQIPHKAIQLDAVRQHRHFCPWIATTGGAAPGWKQTLAALQPQEFSRASPASVIKVDDPLTSIRNLFMSPSTNRKKRSHGSS